MIGAKRIGVLLFVAASVVIGAYPAEGPSAKNPGWVYLQSGPQDLQSKPGRHRHGAVRLGQGTLAPVLKLESKQGGTWAKVQVLDLARLTPQVGWVEVNNGSLLPAEQYPNDSDILRELGGEYLSDFAASHTDIARFLVAQRGAAPLLLVYVASPNLGLARLVAFSVAPGRLTPGPSMAFTLADLEAGILDLGIRDLIGDGNDCIVTHELFHEGPATDGTKLVIRRVVGKDFKTLWKAPLTYRNLGSYPHQLIILKPAERNIGTAGSVTTGEVTFERHENIWEPIWKGIVDFYQIGRDQPLDSIHIEKACPWNGDTFAPLQ